MIEYESNNLGRHISSVIADMIALADANGATVHCEFNGMPLYASPGTTPEIVLAGWTAARDLETNRYRESSEGRAAERRRAREIERKQFEADHLGDLLSYIEADTRSVIKWLQRYTEVADDVAVVNPTKRVLSWFHYRGYEPNVNTGDAYDPTDRENVARYLIGQALEGIKSMGSPHPMFLSWSQDWLDGKWMGNE